MSESISNCNALNRTNYLELVQKYLVSALDGIQDHAHSGPDESAYWKTLKDLILNSITGGKRLRALCVRAGFLLGSGNNPTSNAQAILDLAKIGAATELYQASALAHDDLIDHAQLRRGRPTTHIQAATEHGAPGHPDYAFGESAAILVGDITYAMAMETLTEAVASHSQSAEILQVFAKMTKRVAVGQYLDIVADKLPANRTFNPRRPLEVISYKTAGYSVIDPVCLGAMYAGVGSVRIDQLRRALADWGIAFQLRDDQLGVFSSSTESGKPQYQDIAEGKRTYLLAQTLKLCSTAEATLLEKLYSQSSRSKNECEQVSQIMKDSGAQDYVDNSIDRLYASGKQHLEKLHFPNPQALLELSESLLYRDH